MSIIAQIAIPGGVELLLILLVLVLLFGAQRIPRLARSVGMSLGEFKKGRQELEDEIDDVKSEVGEEAQVVESEIDAAKQDLHTTSDTQTRATEAEPETEAR